jgi:hypothetical protein
MSAGPGTGYWRARSAYTWYTEGGRPLPAAVRLRPLSRSLKMPDLEKSTCPGCGLQKPISETVAYDGYFNTSPECWQVHTDVLGSEFSNAWLLGGCIS